MGFSKILTTAAVAALACMAPLGVQAQNKPLPWDGRGQDVSVLSLDSKFMLHIFKQRQSGAGDPADYVTVDAKGRASAFNGDTGVINVAVDDKAIFGGQTNFRRSELVQNVAGEATTFFRASVMAPAALKNKHVWQVVFPESHQWEIFVDASASPMKIQFKTEARVQWETEFSPKTWYNFGVAITSSGVTLYTSTGNGALAKEWTDGKAITPPSSYEFHFGLLTLSNDGSAPKMVAGQDILSFNGVSVENKISTGGGSGGNGGGSTTAAPEAPSPAVTTKAPAATTKPATEAPATPAATTTAPLTPKPVKTKAPSTPTVTTVKPAATTKAPAATSAPATPAATTKAPSTGGKCKSKRRN